MTMTQTSAGQAMTKMTDLSPGSQTNLTRVQGITTMILNGCRCPQQTLIVKMMKVAIMLISGSFYFLCPAFHFWHANFVESLSQKWCLCLEYTILWFTTKMVPSRLFVYMTFTPSSCERLLSPGPFSDGNSLKTLKRLPNVGSPHLAIARYIWWFICRPTHDEWPVLLLITFVCSQHEHVCSMRSHEQ